MSEPTQNEVREDHRVDPVMFLDRLWHVFANWEPDRVEELWPDRHPTYLAEWRIAFERGFQAVWARMDNENKGRFVALVLREYRSRLGLNAKVLIEEWRERGEKLEQNRADEAELERKIDCGVPDGEKRDTVRCQLKWPAFCYKCMLAEEQSERRAETERAEGFKSLLGECRALAIDYALAKERRGEDATSVRRFVDRIIEARKR